MVRDRLLTACISCCYRAAGSASASEGNCLRKLAAELGTSKETIVLVCIVTAR